MTSTDPSGDTEDAEDAEDAETDPEFVICASCDSKAATSWSFCRSCQSSLEDARPPEEGLEKLGAEAALDMEETGCPKCGQEDAEVDEIAATGTGLTKLFDVQNRRFRVVTCTNCGRGRHPRRRGRRRSAGRPCCHWWCR